MMSLISLPSLGTVGVLLCITLASYVQSLTGFAFGLIFLALVGVFDLIPVGVAANAVTLITLSQTYIYFREYPLTDDWRVIRPAIWPSLGGVVAGLALLFWLSDSALTGLLATGLQALSPAPQSAGDPSGAAGDVWPEPAGAAGNSVDHGAIHASLDRLCCLGLAFALRGHPLQPALPFEALSCGGVTRGCWSVADGRHELDCHFLIVVLA